MNRVVPSTTNLTGIEPESGARADPGLPQSSDQSPSVRARRGTRNARPGGAACRIFAQALGLPAPAGAADVNRPGSTHQRSPYGNGCKSSPK